MPKRGKDHKWLGFGKCLKCKNLLYENKNKNNSLIKKYLQQYQHFSSFEKILKILNLLVNFTKGAIFS